MGWAAAIPAIGGIVGGLFGGGKSKQQENQNIDRNTFTTQEGGSTSSGSINRTMPAWWTNAAQRGFNMAGAGPNDNQRWAWGQGRNLGEQWQGQTGGWNPFSQMPAIQDQLSQTAQGAWLNANPYLQEAISNAQQPVVEQFQEQIMPMLGSAAQRAGAWGGSRQGIVDSNVARDTQRVLGEISSNMAMENFMQERNRMEEAIRNFPAFAQAMQGMQMSPINLVAELGAQEFGTEQERINAFAQMLAAGRPPHSETSHSSGTSWGTTNEDMTQRAVQQKKSGGGLLGVIQGALGGMNLARNIPSLTTPQVARDVGTPSMLPW